MAAYEKITDEEIVRLFCGFGESGKHLGLCREKGTKLPTHALESAGQAGKRSRHKNNRESYDSNGK